MVHIYIHTFKQTILSKATHKLGNASKAEDEPRSAIIQDV